MFFFSFAVAKHKHEMRATNPDNRFTRLGHLNLKVPKNTLEDIWTGHLPKWVASATHARSMTLSFSGGQWAVFDCFFL